MRQLPEFSVTLVDTAHSYGPEVSEKLIREVLHPYPDVLVATKGGLTWHGPYIPVPAGRAEYLGRRVPMSLRRLGVERIGLRQLTASTPRCRARSGLR